MRGAAAASLAALTLLWAGCGEKQENLDPPETQGIEPISSVPRASVIQAQGATAENLAAAAASDRVGPAFKVPVDAWNTRCSDAGQNVNCTVRAGFCSGTVVIRPTKVPSGKSAEDFLPRSDASGVKCVVPKKAEKK